jgi:hypothetical protein
MIKMIIKVKARYMDFFNKTYYFYVKLVKDCIYCIEFKILDFAGVESNFRIVRGRARPELRILVLGCSAERNNIVAVISIKLKSKKKVPIWPNSGLYLSFSVKNSFKLFKAIF